MGKLVEVTIDSLRVSLTNQQRVVVLHEKSSENFLPIWIGPYEAEAITIALQEVEVSRPLTHDLLKNIFTKLNAKLMRIEISAIKDDVFYAKIVVNYEGENVEIDSRPSDALALAVRAHIPIFVDTDVISKAGVHPELESKNKSQPDLEENLAEESSPDRGVEGRLSIFEDFLNTLDIDQPPESEEDSEDPSDNPPKV